MADIQPKTNNPKQKQRLVINIIGLHLDPPCLAQGLQCYEIKEGVDPNFHGAKDNEYVLGAFDSRNSHHPLRPIPSHVDLVGERFQEQYPDMVFRYRTLVFSLPTCLGERTVCDGRTYSSHV